MLNREDVREKAKKIVKVLPGSNCRKCGFDSCGKFAKAVAEQRAPCYGCLSGGPPVAHKVCEIMGVRVPGIANIPVDYSGFPQPGIVRGGMNRSRGRGLGRGQGMRRGPGSGKGFGRRRGNR